MITAAVQWSVLIGDVELQFVPELGIIIVRGHRRDVEKVKRIIAKIVDTAKTTKPAVEVHMLKNVNGKALADLINELTENPTAIDLRPPRDWDRSGKRFGSCEKTKHTIGFAARTDIRSGLEQTIAWTKENTDIIQRWMDQHRFFMQQLTAGSVQ